MSLHVKKTLSFFDQFPLLLSNSQHYFGRSVRGLPRQAIVQAQETIIIGNNPGGSSNTVLCSGHVSFLWPEAVWLYLTSFTGINITGERIKNRLLTRIHIILPVWSLGRKTCWWLYIKPSTIPVIFITIFINWRNRANCPTPFSVPQVICVGSWVYVYCIWKALLKSSITIRWTVQVR